MASIERDSAERERQKLLFKEFEQKSESNTVKQSEMESSFTDLDILGIDPIELDEQKAQLAAYEQHKKTHDPILSGDILTELTPQEIELQKQILADFEKNNTRRVINTSPLLVINPSNPPLLRESSDDSMTRDLEDETTQKLLYEEYEKSHTERTSAQAEKDFDFSSLGLDHSEIANQIAQLDAFEKKSNYDKIGESNLSNEELDLQKKMLESFERMKEKRSLAGHRVKDLNHDSTMHSFSSKGTLSSVDTENPFSNGTKSTSSAILHENIESCRSSSAGKLFIMISLLAHFIEYNRSNNQSC